MVPMSPYKKREVPPTQLVRNSFGSQERPLSLATVIGRCTVGQFAAAMVGFSGMIAAVATHIF
jgi:hypothetical protein